VNFNTNNNKKNKPVTVWANYAGLGSQLIGGLLLLLYIGKKGCLLGFQANVDLDFAICIHSFHLIQNHKRNKIIPTFCTRKYLMFFIHGKYALF